MIKGSLMPAMVLLAGASTLAQAAEVSRNVSVDANPTEVWQVIGPFCAIADWYPGIETCEEELIGGTDHRRLGTADGGEFLEKLLQHDDASMSYSYAILEGPLPVADYSANLSVKDDGGDTVIVWQCSFEPAGVSEEEAMAVMTGVFDGGLEALRERFAK